MSVNTLIDQLRQDPEKVEFKRVMSAIESSYHYVPTGFSNGGTSNAAGTNEGSCKIFSFAKLNGLTEQQTLHCFGDYYREDVLKNPDGEDHGNIRNFMLLGWAGIKFDSAPLTKSMGIE